MPSTLVSKARALSDHSCPSVPQGFNRFVPQLEVGLRAKQGRVIRHDGRINQEEEHGQKQKPRDDTGDGDSRGRHDPTLQTLEKAKKGVRFCHLEYYSIKDLRKRA